MVAPARRVRRAAAATAASAARPSASSTSPAGVRSTRRVVRSSSRTPSRDSSRPIALDSGGWAMPSRSAARVKLSSSATATKYRRSRTSSPSSIPAGYESGPNGSFPPRPGPCWGGGMDADVALVTGANKGIGKEIARQLAGRGLTVLLGARDPERGRKAAAELAADGDVRYLPLDVADDASARAAAEAVAAAHGRLDVLVNNAGISIGRAPAGEVTADGMRQLYAVNVFGMVAVTHAMLPLLRRAAAPRVVNVTSGLGSLTLMAAGREADDFPYLLAYNSSKAALNALTLVYARQLAADGILVNAVSPPYTATDLNRHQGTATPAEGARAIVEMAVAPAGRTGTF